jgi:lipopolysaccharide/colanic/teichoic acid biosynthesis glycosyltransferase
VTAVEAHGLLGGFSQRLDGAVARGTSTLWRVADVAGAAVGLVVLLPILVIVALAVKLDSPGPVLFRQRRVGLREQPFTVNKFRTMRSGAASQPHREYISGMIHGDAQSSTRRASQLYKVVDDDRVTRVGRVLRRWSLDELPQLWNVLWGEMSLVGPRPAIPYELDHYERDWYGRFSVKPGMTGLWQVSGRSELTFREMIRLDLVYASTWSLWLNVRILAKTAVVVLRGRGAA